MKYYLPIAALIVLSACSDATSPQIENKQPDVPFIGTDPMKAITASECQSRCGFEMDFGQPAAWGFQVSDMAQVTGAFGWSTNAGHKGFRWRLGSSEALASLGGENYPTGINNAGQVAGYSVLVDATGAAIKPQAVVWEPDGKLYRLPQIDNGRAVAINDDAVVVGELTDGGAVRPFRWSLNGGLTVLSQQGGNYGRANDINHRGEVVGTVLDAGDVWRAVLWSASNQAQQLTPLPGMKHCEARAINERGWVVGSCYNDGPTVDGRGFLWKPETGMINFNPGGMFYPADLNHWGEIAGWGFDEDGTRRALVYYEGYGVMALDELGYNHTAAVSINSWGDVVGAAFDDLNNRNAAARKSVAWLWAENRSRFGK